MISGPARIGWVAAWWGRLSTGLKMLMILSVGLFPLGVVAVLASIESARDNSAKRADQTLARVEIKAQRLTGLLSRSADMIRTANAALSATPRNSGVCESTLRRLSSAQSVPGQFALYGAGELRCATAGYQPVSLARSDGSASVVEIDETGRVLRFALFGTGGELEGVGEFGRDAIADLSRIPGVEDDVDVALVQGGRLMDLHDGRQSSPLSQTVRAMAPIGDGQLHIRIAREAVPLSAIEILLILLPVMMAIFAALTGWFIVDRLLLRPLVRMQTAVSAYQPGDRHLDLPPLTTPAREIGELGRAFDKVTQMVARHEAELEAAIERQTRLVREVHHRVKNNLQVVASLLNLHARGAASEDVANAYASIQRRVDALSVVHRNHYAELEENRGVAIRPLISELTANLRATAPEGASHMGIKLDIAPFHVTQDVAVSITFLITELVEYAMLCGGQPVTICVDDAEGSTALLSVQSESLTGNVTCDEAVTERLDRIVTGLSRQLRSLLDRDVETGLYRVTIMVADKQP